MRLKLLVLLATGAVTILTAKASLALPQFNKEFKNRYASNDVDSAIKEKLSDHKCAICHVKVNGKVNKKKRNHYGAELDKLLTKKDKRNTEKIRQALETVEKLEVAEGQTWADLFATGELPKNEEREPGE